MEGSNSSAIRSIGQREVTPVLSCEVADDTETKTCAACVTVTGSVASFERTHQPFAIRHRDAGAVVRDRYKHADVGLFHGVFDGPRRYNELQRRVAEISQRMLTLSLKALVEDGLVSRIPYATVPPRVDYELTPLEFSLRDALRPLWKWALVHMKDGAPSETA